MLIFHSYVCLPGGKSRFYNVLTTEKGRLAHALPLQCAERSPPQSSRVSTAGLVEIQGEQRGTAPNQSACRSRKMPGSFRGVHISSSPAIPKIPEQDIKYNVFSNKKQKGTVKDGEDGDTLAEKSNIMKNRCDDRGCGFQPFDVPLWLNVQMIGSAEASWAMACYGQLRSRCVCAFVCSPCNYFGGPLEDSPSRKLERSFSIQNRH